MAALPEFAFAAPPAPRGYHLFKRMCDVVVSLIILLVCSPLLLLIAVLIRLTSKGPIFFSQLRIGENGRVFVMYKFRSMYQNADHTLHQVAYVRFLQGDEGNGKVGRDTLALVANAMEHGSPAAIEPTPQLARLRARFSSLLHNEDPRITPVGAVLRMTSLDELPQFLNVLFGDMTLVGPRPPIPYEVRLYHPRHYARLSVRPGITGVWQVYGRNKVPFEQMVEMDLRYIRERSVALDLKLMVLTPRAMLRTHGAN